MIIISQDRKHIVIFDTGTIQADGRKVEYLGGGVKCVLGDYYISSEQKADEVKIRKVIEKIVYAKIAGEAQYIMPSENEI